MASQSRYTAFLPGYELTWSTTSYSYDDAARYTGAYYDGTAYSNVLAAVGKRVLCLKQALVSSGWTVVQSSTTTHVLAGDLWTNAPDIERGTGHWIVLRGPDGVSQLVIQKDYVADTRAFYFFWSPNGSFTTGTVPSTRPTAPDEIAPGNQSSVGDVAPIYGGAATGAFYGFRGVRGTEVTSRVVQVDGGDSGKIEFMFCLEWFVTDLPASVYPRNVCLFAFNTGNTKNFFDKDTACVSLAYVRITMPDGRAALPTKQYCPVTYPGHFVSEEVGTLDSKSRMLPMYVQEYAASGDHQFFGYIPDMYWGNNNGALFSWYNYRTFGGVWSRYAELCLPYFATAYATNLGDSDAVAAVICTASEANSDDVPATFAGIVSATTIDNNTMRVTWAAASDNVSIAETLVYEIHCATSAAAPFRLRGETLGTITYDVTLLKPGTTYYFRVRCRDEAGNVDANSVEVSATTGGAIDIVAPTAARVSPPANQALGPFSTCVIDVEDETALRRIWITVEYPDASPALAKEFIFDGDTFEPVNFGNCSRVELSTDKKFRFYITRTTGWPSKPRIVARTIDEGGNEIELPS